MKTRFLLPHKCRKIGWIFMIPAAIVGSLILFLEESYPFLEMRLPVLALVSDKSNFLPEGIQIFKLIETNATPTIIGVVLIISATLVAFSKEEQEDEYISTIRLESLVWATYINYGLLLISFLLFWGQSFLYVMEINMFTVLLIFIIRFNFILYRLKKNPMAVSDEKPAQN